MRNTAQIREVLARLRSPEPPPFAVLHRPEATADEVTVLLGDIAAVDRLADLPVPDDTGGPARHDVLAVIPYRQIAERGFPAPDDGAPLLAMTVRRQVSVPLTAFLRAVGDSAIDVRDGEYDLDDDAYAALVERIREREIRAGAGANFVLRRTYRATLGGHPAATGLTLFRRLLRRENGAYWTFCVYTGERTFVGASPERHLSLSGGVAVMNPVSGTYRYPPGGPVRSGLLGFLAETKESEELWMVLDEELKMMARICSDGCQVRGPFLKEMARLAHTEYLIEGRTGRDVRDLLSETMFAPTVTGSPVESAAEVISRYEPEGRGYYSGVLALVGRDGRGGRRLDSSIMIRTADIDARGQARIAVGATLVRHSDPRAEAAETRAKAEALLAALTDAPVVPLGSDPDVRRALHERNRTLAPFWFGADTGGHKPVPAAAGRRVLVVDAEDTFTWMIARQVRSLGPEVTVVRHDEVGNLRDNDLVILGPGPGDPQRRDDPRIARLEEMVRSLLDARHPVLAVCLSHQVLCRVLGLQVRPLPAPNQGVQREIDLFGQDRRVGFYNSFAARCGADTLTSPAFGEPVEVARTRSTGVVHALRARGLRSLQFHAESVLTQDGIGILREMIVGLFSTAETPVVARPILDI